MERPWCVNCRKPHPAGYGGCIAKKEAEAALKIVAAAPDMDYKKALLRVRVEKKKAGAPPPSTASSSSRRPTTARPTPAATSTTPPTGSRPTTAPPTPAVTSSAPTGSRQTPQRRTGQPYSRRQTITVRPPAVDQGTQADELEAAHRDDPECLDNLRLETKFFEMMETLMPFWALLMPSWNNLFRPMMEDYYDGVRMDLVYVPERVGADMEDSDAEPTAKGAEGGR